MALKGPFPPKLFHDSMESSRAGAGNGKDLQLASVVDWRARSENDRETAGGH